MLDIIEEVWRCDKCGATATQDIDLCNLDCGHMICNQHRFPCPVCYPVRSKPEVKQF